MIILRQSTAKDIKLGPFVDKTDGVTYEAGMAAAMDHATTGVRLSKNGAALADRAEATQPVYDAFGYYLVKLDTTDTNTVGTLKVIFGDAAVCLPCEANFQIIEEAVFDALYAASAGGYGTAQTGDSFAIVNGAHGLVSIQDDIDEILVDTAVIGALGAGLTGIPWNAAWDAEVQSECTDALNAYDPPTKGEMDSAFSTTNGKVDVVDGIVDDILVDTGTTIPNAIDAIDNYIDTEISAILEDTGTTLPASLAALDAKIDIIDTNVDSVLVDTGTTLDGKIDVIDGIVDNILTDTGTTLDGKIDTIDTVVDAVKAKTDSLTFTVAGEVDSNVQSVNDTALTGNGSALTPWGPA